MALVNTRAMLEKLWTDRLYTYEYQSVGQAEDGSEVWDEVQVLDGVPCKLSFGPAGQNPPTNEKDTLPEVAQVVKVFLGNEYTIKPGSKLQIFRETGHMFVYALSGMTSVFSQHQEITLKNFEDYA